MRFGQSSVSTSTQQRRVHAPRARAARRPASRRARRTGRRAPRTLFCATALPVRVVVERKTRWPGKRSLQRRHQRPRRQHLAHRDRVDPDRAVAVEVQVDGQPAHALAEGAQVLARGAALPEIEGQSDQETDGEDDAVEDVHLGVSGPRLEGAAILVSITSGE